MPIKDFTPNLPHLKYQTCKFVPDTCDSILIEMRYYLPIKKLKYLCLFWYCFNTNCWISELIHGSCQPASQPAYPKSNPAQKAFHRSFKALVCWLSCMIWLAEYHFRSSFLAYIFITYLTGTGTWSKIRLDIFLNRARAISRFFLLFHAAPTIDNICNWLTCLIYCISFFWEAFVLFVFVGKAWHGRDMLGMWKTGHEAAAGLLENISADVGTYLSLEC